MAVYKGSEIDKIVNDTKFLSLDVETHILRAETDTEIKEVDVDCDLDVYPLVTSIISYVFSEEVSYGEEARSSMIDVCIQACKVKINNIIENGVIDDKKITPIVLECCAELAAMITRINPLMVSSGGGAFMFKAFSTLYPYVVKKVNEERAKA